MKPVNLLQCNMSETQHPDNHLGVEQRHQLAGSGHERKTRSGVINFPALDLTHDAAFWPTTSKGVATQGFLRFL